MHFLPDVYVPCEVCKGKRYNRETLEVRYKGKNIAEVLDMSVEEAVEFFANQHKIRRRLQTLHDVGLGYIKLGQPSTTLSGGEAQRVKLATELAKVATGNTLYILDEPTTGLHFADMDKLLEVLQRLVDAGQHGAGDRAQPGRDQVRRLDHRPGAGGRRRRGRVDSGGDAGGDLRPSGERDRQGVAAGAARVRAGAAPGAAPAKAAASGRSREAGRRRSRRGPATEARPRPRRRRAAHCTKKKAE